MIKKFKVKNFRGFNDELILDFDSGREYKFNEYALSERGITKNIVVFGKNGSGKSNLGYALFDITAHLSDRNNALHNNPTTIYLNGDSANSEASFSYEFAFGDDVLRYKYMKTDPQTLTYEELYVNDVKVFAFNYRTGRGDYSNLDLIGAQNINMSNRSMNISVVRFLANNANLDEGSLLMQLTSFVDKMLWYRSIHGPQFIGSYSVENMIHAIIKANKVDDLKEFLATMDVNLNLVTSKLPTGQEEIYVKFKNKTLPFASVASSGTWTLTLQYYWSLKYSEVSFLFIDEFDAYYHFEAAEKIIKSLSREEKFQSVLTTHNTSLASNSILRPDCFFYLKNGKITAFVSATEKSLREGHNLEKMLRAGEFSGQ